VALCLSVLSQVGVLLKQQDVLNWFLARRLPSTYTVLHGNTGMSKIRALPSRTLTQALDFENFVMACCSLRCIVNLGRQMWTLSVIHWTVIGGTKLTVLAMVNSYFHTERPILITVCEMLKLCYFDLLWICYTTNCTDKKLSK